MSNPVITSMTSGDLRVISRCAKGYDFNHFNDDELLYFGYDKDASIKWDSTNSVLEVLPLTDNTGALNIGDGTTDFDVKVFLGSTTTHSLFDVSSGCLTMTLAPINFSGAYTDDCIDFTSVAIDHTGSNGPCLIRAGTYASPVTNADEDQSGMIRLYSSTTADGSSYDRGVFVCEQTYGLKAVFPVSGLAEIKAQSGNGPTKSMAAQFITMLQDSTSKLAALGGDATAGMYGAWLKVGGVTGSTTASGSRVAAVWLDNQLSSTVSGEEYAAFITCGASKVDAVFGFETTSSGWTNLFYFDETAYDQDPVSASGCDVSGAGASEAYLKVDLNGTAYGIPLIAI